MALYIHDFIPVTAVEGPGLRACLWVQGCSVRCEGCMVPHTWDRSKGKLVDKDVLLDTILSTPEIEGITILGGEPMDQAAELLPLLKKIKNAGLSVMLFTGYTKEILLAKECDVVNEIIKLSDIFVDGPYVKSLTDFSRPWVGSSNQRIFFQSTRYRHLESKLHTIENKVEVRLEEGGGIKINGMLPKEKFDELQRAFRRIK